MIKHCPDRFSLIIGYQLAPMVYFWPSAFGILIQRHVFIYVLVLIDVAVFLFPFAFGIEEPILDTGVTQLQSLSERGRNLTNLAPNPSSGGP